MASAIWSNRFRRDPLRFLSGREICPGPRQSDQFLRQRVALSQDLHSKDLVGHYGCVNAIEFSHGSGQLLASGGDDRRVLIWNVEKSLSDIGKPAVMRGEHNSNIFSVGFDINNRNLFSGGNDEQVIVHDIETEETKDVFQHDDAVYGISPDPSNPYVFASSCGDGRVLIYDIRESTAEPFCLANYTSSMHAVIYNPVEPRLLATANAKEGLGLWDVRKPRSCVLRYGGSYVQQSCMSVRFNQRGDQLIALRRRLPPVLYRIHSNEPVCEFDHSGYYNSCTMKSVCYAGDNDQYILSGSDEFNLYMWAVPEDLSERLYINSAHMVLKGHRSIVNQVRFNSDNHLIVSSGVEKVIKVWSPFRLPSKTDNTTKNVFRERPVYSHEEYINLVLQDGHVMSHDYSHESTEEDPRMMAFFDSLVQRELEGWSSDDSLSSNEEELYSRIVQMSQTDVDSDDSLTQPIWRQSDDEPSFSPFSIAFASVMASRSAEGNSRFPRLNSALERAERLSNTNDEGNNSSRASDAETSDRNEREGAGTSASIPKRNIAKLVQKKKRDLKQTLQRYLKDCKAKVSSSSSSDSSDTSELSESDEEVSDLNIVIGDKQDLKSGKEHLSQATKECMKAESEVKKQALQRLKKLRALRESVMEENTAKDVETKTGTVADAVASTSTAFHTGEKSSAVQFKSFKRKLSSSKGKDRQDYCKSRGSPDQGPYLQKNVPASVVDVHQASEEMPSDIHKHLRDYPSDSRSKHRSILDYRHKRDRESSGHSRSCKTSERHSRKDLYESDRYGESYKRHREHACKHVKDTDERDTVFKAEGRSVKNKGKVETVSLSEIVHARENKSGEQRRKHTSDVECDSDVGMDNFIDKRFSSTKDKWKQSEKSDCEINYRYKSLHNAKDTGKVLKVPISECDVNNTCEHADRITVKSLELQNSEKVKYCCLNSDSDSDSEGGSDESSKRQMPLGKVMKIKSSTNVSTSRNKHRNPSIASKNICDICGVELKFDTTLCNNCKHLTTCKNEKVTLVTDSAPSKMFQEKEVNMSHSNQAKVDQQEKQIADIDECGRGVDLSSNGNSKVKLHSSDSVDSESVNIESTGTKRRRWSEEYLTKYCSDSKYRNGGGCESIGEHSKARRYSSDSTYSKHRKIDSFHSKYKDRESQDSNHYSSGKQESSYLDCDSRKSKGFKSDCHTSQHDRVDSHASKHSSCHGYLSEYHNETSVSKHQNRHYHETRHSSSDRHRSRHQSSDKCGSVGHRGHASGHNSDENIDIRQCYGDIHISKHKSVDKSRSVGHSKMKYVSCRNNDDNSDSDHRHDDHQSDDRSGLVGQSRSRYASGPWSDEGNGADHHRDDKQVPKHQSVSRVHHSKSSKSKHGKCYKIEYDDDRLTSERLESRRLEGSHRSKHGGSDTSLRHQAIGSGSEHKNRESGSRHPSDSRSKRHSCESMSKLISSDDESKGQSSDSGSKFNNTTNGSQSQRVVSGSKYQHSDNGPGGHRSGEGSEDYSRAGRESHHPGTSSTVARHDTSSDSSSDSNDDRAQPTWTEFKRFKNKLERARKRYQEHKHRHHRRDSRD